MKKISFSRLSPFGWLKKKKSAPECCVENISDEDILSGCIRGSENFPVVEASVMKWLSKDNFSPKYAFAESIRDKVVMVKRRKFIPENLWFVGDIHGDIVALRAIIALIEKNTPNASIVFLGDLFDRHPYSYEVVITVLDLIRTRPDQILWIAGNHDIGLKYNEGKFSSDCIPSEFADFLNTRPDLKEFGQKLCILVEKLPRALFLTDGLICTHGAVPHIDVPLNDPFSLSSETAQTDFTWSRIHPRAPKKHIDRISKGCELGYEDVSSFCMRAAKITRYPLRRVLCGHQHPNKNGQGFEELKHKIPTMILNSSFFSENPFLKSQWMTPYIARYRYDALPQKIPVKISEQTLSELALQISGAGRSSM